MGMMQVRASSAATAFTCTAENGTRRGISGLRWARVGVCGLGRGRLLAAVWVGVALLLGGGAAPAMARVAASGVASAGSGSPARLVGLDRRVTSAVQRHVSVSLRAMRPVVTVGRRHTARLPFVRSRGARAQGRRSSLLISPAVTSTLAPAGVGTGAHAAVSQLVGAAIDPACAVQGGYELCSYGFTRQEAFLTVPDLASPTTFVEMAGGAGGDAQTAQGGRGGYLSGDINVAGGDQLVIQTGGKGGNAGAGGGQGGWPDGGNTGGNAGGGGGSSVMDLQRSGETNPTLFALAAGGGGAGSDGGSGYAELNIGSTPVGGAGGDGFALPGKPGQGGTSQYCNVVGGGSPGQGPIGLVGGAGGAEGAGCNPPSGEGDGLAASLITGGGFGGINSPRGEGGGGGGGNPGGGGGGAGGGADSATMPIHHLDGAGGGGGGGTSAANANILSNAVPKIWGTRGDGFVHVLFVVGDITPPVTTIDSAADPTQADATITFHGTDAGTGNAPSSGIDHFECQLDSGAWATCSSPKTYPGLSTGTHTISVQAVDGNGNVENPPATTSWTFTDTTPPTTSITSPPPDPTYLRSASIAFTATDNSGPGEDGIDHFECQLDGGGFAPCTSPATYSGLSAGEHSFEVRAVDRGGNDSTPAQANWSVTNDTVTTIDSAPDPTQADATITFSGTAVVGSGIDHFECQLDSGAWATCSSPQTYPGLSTGPHTFKVRAVDGNGNVENPPATTSWTFTDTTPPTTSITSPPPDPTYLRSASIAFTATDNSGPGEDGIDHFECQLDGGGFAPCTSPATYSGLSAGEHSFEVRAVDRGGNDSTPAQANWTASDAADPSTCTTSGTRTTCPYTTASAWPYRTWTVPDRVTHATITADGAAGGASDGDGGFIGGQGGSAVATIAVTPGEVLRIFVGGFPGDGDHCSLFVGPGANGGGAGDCVGQGAGGGGGASDVRRAPYGLGDRLIVGGGGGGAAPNFEAGGSGGGLTGTAGAGPNGGGGGSQTQGGDAGAFDHTVCGSDSDPTAGALGLGGSGATCAFQNLFFDGIGGGGGGGYYGGGGGGDAGTDSGAGGGGSSYAEPTATNVTLTTGGQSGDGQVQIAYSPTASQTINVTTHAPPSAAYRTSFTVAATGGGSPNPVTYAGSGACSNSGSTFTMTSSTGICTVTYDQAGDDNYDPAPQVQETVTAQKASQTINVTTHAPPNAAYGTSFTVAATGGGSPNPVTYAGSGACSNSGSTFMMTSSTGICTVTYDQAGDDNYHPAPQVQESVTAQKASQAIRFTSTPPASPVYGGSYTVTATGGASGNSVVFSIDRSSAAGACSISGAKVLFTSAGSCVIDANQAGTASYAPAPQVQQTLTIVYSKTVSGNSSASLTVTAGQGVLIAPGARVNAALNVLAGGSLDIEGATVTGPLTATGGVAIKACGSTITGPVTITADTGQVTFGDGGSCAGNTITGPVKITGGTGTGVTFDNNTVTGPLTITHNKGTINISHNKVSGPTTTTPNP